MNTMTSRLAAAAALLVVLGATAACGQDDPQAEAPTQTPTQTQAETTTPPATTAPAEEILELTASPALGKCKVPTAEDLRTLQNPFLGTVTDVSDSVVSLDVTEHFDDATFTAVRMTYLGTGTGLSDGTVDFEVGQQALVASVDGQVAGCGRSGPLTDDLSDLYRAAFG